MRRAATLLALLAAALTAPAGASAQDSCPNAEFRTGFSAGLPDCRAFEQVSPSDKSQTNISGFGWVTDDGNRAAVALQAVVDPVSQPSAQTSHVAERTDSGWESTSLGGPPQFVWQTGFGLASVIDYTSDLSSGMTTASTSAQLGLGQAAFYSPGIDGSWTRRSPLLKPLTGTLDFALQYYIVGTSTDMTRVLFVPGSIEGANSSVTLLPDDPAPGPTGHAANLYEAYGSDTGEPQLRLVARDPSGNVLGGRCGASLGAKQVSGATHKRNAISADGSTLYFTTRPGQTGTGNCTAASNPLRVIKRQPDGNFLEVSQSQCTRTAGDPGGACGPATGDDRYETASRDGSKVFFTTPRQLVGSATDRGDTDTTSDLYLYDSSPPAGQPNLVQVSAGEVTDTHPTIGNGADVRGVTIASENGDRIYFVANGKLTATPNSQGVIALGGQPNLYVYQRDDAHPAGRIAFIGRLDPADGVTTPTNAGVLWDNGDQRSAQAMPMLGDEVDGVDVGGDGRYLVFATKTPLVTSGPGADTDTSFDVYRYDDMTGAIVRISTGAGGAGNAASNIAVPAPNPRSSPSLARLARWVSEDAQTIVFATREQLTPDDSNAWSDIYSWRDGDVGRISQGSVLKDNGFTISEGFGTQITRSYALSASGDSVFYTSSARLTPSDIDNATDLYVARVGGGFPPPPPDVGGDGGCDPLAGECEGDGGSPVATIVGTLGGGSGNAAPGMRATLTVNGLSASARRRAARTGTVRLKVRTTVDGTVKAVARAKLGKRRVVVARGSHAGSGSTTFALRLSKAARRWLGKGRRLRLDIAVQAPAARAKSLQVTLRRAGK